MTQPGRDEPPAKHVFVSPHFDDAVFSCGAALLCVGPSSHVITVCGGVPDASILASSWDLRCGFASAADAAATRRREDATACDLVGAQACHLQFLDRPYSPRTDPRDIADALDALIVPGSIVWAPAGIGGHADHTATRIATLLVARRACASVRLYADTPYASARGWKTPDRERDAAFRWEPALRSVRRAGYGLSPTRTRQLAPADAARKIALARTYASQLAAMGAHYPTLTSVAGDLSVEVWWDCVDT